MSSSESNMSRAAFWLAGGSAVAVVFSIAAGQILLGAALIALLFSDLKLRFPPIWLPLGLFMAGTVVSVMLSADSTLGRPQMRKFIVFFLLLVVYSTFRELGHMRNLFLCWAGAAAITASRGLVQFAQKYGEAQYAGRNFYEHYVGERISGFSSNWMTFSGQLLIVFLLLAAFLLFSPFARRKPGWLGAICAVILAAAIVLTLTRSVWVAAVAGGVYLVWHRRNWLLLALPVVLVVGAWFSPAWVRGRLVSVVQPRGDVDSNQFRIVCWRTGWEMIKAHPWFGVGPEQVKPQFDRYVPPDIPRPLPLGWYGHLHNIYVHYAAERGVPTMLMLVWLLVKVLFDFLSAIRKLPPGPGEAKALLHGCVAVVLAVMVEGVFELNLGDSEVLMMFLTVVACGYAARDRALEANLPAA
jgi:putative inorganic carbon (HCO3(-)) transporter